MKNTNRPLFFLVSTYSTLFLLAAIFIGTQALSSCTSKKEVLENTADAAAIITYTKVRGRGSKLPLYTLEVLDSKVIRYTGIMNVPKIGEQLIPMKDRDYDNLLAQFKAASFKDFEASYKTKMRDLPLTRISFDDHTITYQEAARPASLIKLTDLVEGLVVL